jgi:cytochrome c peroxidase
VRRAERRIVLAAVVVAVFGVASCGDTPTPPPGGEQPGPPPDPLVIEAPVFGPQPVRADNPTTVQGAELGRHLFFDPILSADSTMSCATCHRPEFAFSDPRPLSIGIRGLPGTRHAPTLTNVGWNLSNFWDGRASNLETQAIEPVPHPLEMDLPWDTAIERLRRNPRYPPMFRAAFRTSEINRERVVKAIAQFERTLVSVDSRFDRYLRDRDRYPLTTSELRGFLAFFTEKADCFHCHLPDYTFTDFAFQNNGLDSVFVDVGRNGVTNDPRDMGLFKTPGLRNVALTAPYMHDGRFATLEEVIEHYHHGAVASPTIHPRIRTGRDTLEMNASDKADLLAFLRCLTDSSIVTNPGFQSPFP